MAKDPAFLFYPNDFTSGTRFMTDEQVGKYIRLLCAQFDCGHLDENHMIMICKSYDNHIFSKFIKDSEGKYFNERLDIEKVKRKEYCKGRGENKKGKKIISLSYDSHMENENISSIVYNKIGIKNFFEDSQNDLIWIESSCMALGLTKEGFIKGFVSFKNHIKSTDLQKSETLTEWRKYAINWIRQKIDTLKLKNDPKKLNGYSTNPNQGNL